MPALPQYTPQQLVVNGETREYLVHTPAGAVDLPLLIVFHGGGGRARQMARPWMNYENGDFVIALPQAKPIYGRKWQHAMPGNPAYPNDDVEFVEELIAAEQARPQVSCDDVYVAGFSSGAGMVWQLTMLDHFIGVIKGFATVAQQLHDEKLNTADPVAERTPQPVIYIHGTADRNWARPPNAPTPPETFRYWQQRNQVDMVACNATLFDALVGDDMCAVKQLYEPQPDGAALCFITVVNGGHNWPGVGVDPDASQDFSATDEIVNFWRGYAGL